MVEPVNLPGHDEPPNTWPRHETAFPLGPDNWAMWANIAGTATGTRRADGTWDTDIVMTGDTAPGLMEWHWNAVTNHWCGGYVGFRNRGDHAGHHELVTADPLTISPSLLCQHCSSHGFVENGSWRGV